MNMNLDFILKVEDYVFNFTYLDSIQSLILKVLKSKNSTSYNSH